MEAVFLSEPHNNYENRSIHQWVWFIFESHFSHFWGFTSLIHTRACIYMMHLAWWQNRHLFSLFLIITGVIQIFKEAYICIIIRHYHNVTQILQYSNVFNVKVSTVSSNLETAKKKRLGWINSLKNNNAAVFLRDRWSWKSQRDSLWLFAFPRLIYAAGGEVKRLQRGLSVLINSTPTKYCQ